LKEFIGTCVDNPFYSVGDLCQVVEYGNPISKKTFIANCAVHLDILKAFTKFPHDYEFYHYKGIIGDYYFYTWSAIEHFYN
jgi:hypothetical protein